MKEQIDKRDQSIQDLTDRVKDLEKKTREQSQEIEDNSSNIQTHTTVLNDHTKRIEKLEKITDDIQTKLGTSKPEIVSNSK